jgi:hypothetical protein
MKTPAFWGVGPIDSPIEMEYNSMDLAVEFIKLRDIGSLGSVW